LILTALGIGFLLLPPPGASDEEKQDPSQVRALRQKAAELEKAGMYGGALAVYEKAAALANKVHGPGDLATAQLQHLLAGACRRMGQYSRADSLLQNVLEVYETKKGKNHSDVAEVLLARALVLADLGEFGKAGPLCQRALTIQIKHFGRDSPQAAAAMNDLAFLLIEFGL
jgi:tetratricopeptide (TPR) repeat protein